MTVKLIHITPDVEKHISYCARVSSPNQDNPNIAGLLKYCLKHKHMSIFEMGSMCVEITTSRAISQQIIRHKSFSFQEFCISGDSLITTILPSNGLPNYIPIKRLYEKQKNKNYNNLQLRVYDEIKKEFTTAKLKQVFKTGLKPCFKVYFNDGKTITTTKEHKFLTKDGFETLEEALGLKQHKNTVTLCNPKQLAVNGIPCYQNKEWLLNAKLHSIENKTGVNGIAKAANISYHTIRKWLKLLDLKFTKKEVSLYPELSYNIDNIIPFHKKCHTEHHGKSYSWQEIRKNHKGNTLSPKFVKIDKVEYIGDIETYDLEVDHPSHNYVANKIIVHNSQRYAEVQKFEIYEARRQDHKNRQNSIDDMSEEDREWFENAQASVINLAATYYTNGLDRNIAKEQMRFLLPLSTQTKLYMHGTIRSFINYLEVRTDVSTQLEHREIANAIKEIFCKELPIIAESLNWK